MTTQPAGARAVTAVIGAVVRSNSDDDVGGLGGVARRSAGQVYAQLDHDLPGGGLDLMGWGGAAGSP